MYRLRIFAVFAMLAVIVACKRTHPRIAGAVVPGTLGSSPTMITLLGCQADTQQGTTVQCEQATPWVGSQIGSATNIWCYDFAKLDSTHFAIDVDVADVKASDATGHARYQIGWEPVLQANGTLSDPTANGPYVAHSNVGSVMVGTVATLTQVGNSACLQVTCANSNGPYCLVHSSASLSRGVQPLAVTAVSPASLNTTVATATNVTITTTPGGATNANGCTLAGYSVPGFATSQTSVTCVVPPGIYTASVGAAAVTTPANVTIAFANGFRFGNIGTLFTVAGSRPHPSGWIGAVGGDPVTITGAGFVTGGGLAVSCNGHALTSVAFSSSTTLTGVAPAQAGVASPTSAYNCTGTNGDGSALMGCTSCITYDWDPSQTGDIYWWGRADTGVTNGGGTATAWAPLVDNSTLGSLATSATCTSNPTYTSSCINSMPCIGFTVSHQCLQSASTGISESAYSISMVGISLAASNEEDFYVTDWSNKEPTLELYQTTFPLGLFAEGTASNLGPSTGQSAFQSNFFATVVYGGSAVGYLNGSSIVTGTVGNGTLVSLMVGTWYNGLDVANGKMSEVIAETSAISGATEAKLHTYAQNFWGTP